MGGWAASASDWIAREGDDLWDWYRDLPLLGKAMPGLYAAGEGIQAAGETIENASDELQSLWAHRQALLDFIKALHEQSVNAVQIAIETLAPLGGPLGTLMQALWDHGPQWVQGLIEICRQTETLQHVFASVGAVFVALPPNLWTEGIGTAIGYLVPELLVAVILAVLTAFTAGADAPALAARLASTGAKLRHGLSLHGQLGHVLELIYDGIKKLGGTIADLVRVVWRNVEESVEGAANKFNPVLRHVSRPERRATAGDDVVEASAPRNAERPGAQKASGDGSTGERNKRLSFWQKKQVNGRNVYQRDDLIDPNKIDDRGRTNFERMQKGLAPLGPDGKSINLHHLTHDEPGAIAEVGQSFHKDNHRILHIYPNGQAKIGYGSAPPSVDRQAFGNWARSYWKFRAEEFR